MFFLITKKYALFHFSLNLPCNISHSNAGLKSEIYYIKKTKLN